MKRLLVLIPESIFIKYYVYQLDGENDIKDKKKLQSLFTGEIKFRGSLNSKNEIKNLIDKINPFSIMIRVVHGGNENNEAVVYNKSYLSKLIDLVRLSPLDMPMIIKLIQFIEGTNKSPEIILFFETAFFSKLPVRERLYALDSRLINTEVQRYGYHGMFHKAAVEKVNQENKEAKKIISICLEPKPEITAIFCGIPVMVSSGSTPLEGIPGDTTCGELDPGILILLQEKKKMGVESINEILTNRSGLSAIAGERVTINDVYENDIKYEKAKYLLDYNILLACGSAIAAMNGVDAIVFSGKYINTAGKLADILIPQIMKSAAKKTKPYEFYLKDGLEHIIADYFVDHFYKN